MSDSRLIVHDNRDGVIYWLATDRKQVNAAMRALFNLLDSRGCYNDWCNPDVQDDLEAARAGQHAPIYRILKARQGYTNEKWRVIYAIDPCEPKP